MLFRSALCRLAADLPKTSATYDLPQLARFVQRTLRTHNGLSLPVARALSRVYKSSLVESRRSYATTRKTKTTGTVKKAAAAKKPKKKTPNKTAKKAAPKKKTGPKRVKKEFTPEQKEKAVIKELKKRALKEPVRKVPFNPWLAFWTDAVKGCKSVSEVHQAAKSAGAKWHNLSPTEREHYNVRAKEVTDARRRDYDAWVRSHTPEEIRVANIARAILTNKLNASSKKNRYPYPKIEDERQVKRAAIPHIRYYQERATAGDYKGILAQEAVKLASSDYKALSASEKKKYEDAYKLDVERYQREYKQTYGHEPASNA